jgi:hypothetical protein
VHCQHTAPARKGTIVNIGRWSNRLDLSKLLERSACLVGTMKWQCRHWRALLTVNVLPAGLCERCESFKKECEIVGSSPTMLCAHSNNVLWPSRNSFTAAGGALLDFDNLSSPSWNWRLWRTLWRPYAYTASSGGKSMPACRSMACAMRFCGKLLSSPLRSRH